MLAWVTIAPRGESASLAVSLPILVSQSPTQLRVTVTANGRWGAKLKKCIKLNG